ncbi:hypothetical protein JCM18905_4932 [Vibrio sp. JCM 18905]|nr:hypothetical protein JCM18905_4932 [Vibrio sp. JCM 18905]
MKIESNKVLEMVSAFVLLGVSIYFGYNSKPAEMGGLTIAAGFLGLVFANLDKFKSFKAAGVEAQLREEQIKAVLEKEIEAPTDFFDETESQVPNVSLVPDNAKSVLESLQSHEYTWRYVSGISKETSLTRVQVKESLQWLSEHGYAKKSLGKNGEIWASTQEGRYLYAVICFDGGVPVA